MLETGFISSFKGSRVLVTGNSGFKGSWLSLLLRAIGAEVIGVSNDVPTRPALHDDLHQRLGIETIWKDVNDTPYLQKLISDFKPQFVFHLAAQAIVGKGFSNPLDTWRSNALGTVSVLEAIRTSGMPSVTAIFITSDKVYKNHEWAWGYRENDELGGYDPYSASKAAAELAISSYANSGLFRDQNIKLASVRAGNVIGGGDWAQGRIVPDTVRAWSSKTPLILRNPSSTRPWQHVLEPLGGYLLTAAALENCKLISGASFNFGPSEKASKSVEELVFSLRDRLGAKGNLQVTMQPHEIYESGLLRLSSEKAQKELMWEPLLEFNQTMDWTADWYSGHSSGIDVYDLSLNQVKEYIELMRGGPFWKLA